MKLQRRLFLAGLGGMGVGIGLGGVSHLFPLPSPRVGPEWRPGDEQSVPSTCLLCPSHCGIVGRLVDGSLVSIDGNPLHPVSRGGVCPKGKAGIQLLYHPGRLQGAAERAGAGPSSGFRPTGWDEALERVAGVLRGLRAQGRSSAVGYLAGDVGGTLGDLIRRFLEVYGSPHLLEEGYGDGSRDVMELMQGRKSTPAFDLDRASLVLSFGAPLSEAWWCLPQAARARDVAPDKRRRWIQADTRLSRSAAAADEWLPMRPGSYGTLALGIAYVLLKEGLYDSEWIHDSVEGFEDWTDEAGKTVPGYRSLVLRHGRTESVADRIGLPVERIVELAKEFGRAERPLALWDQVVSWRSGGPADALAIHSLNVLTGSLQRPGGVYVQRPPELPALDELAPAAKPEPMGARMDATDWAERVLEGADPPLEVLFLHHANPVASAPKPDRVRQALERIPLVVSFSPFLDETTRHADLILPDHIYLERWQDALAPASVPFPVWSVVQPMVAPLHDTRATGDVLLKLAAGIGGEMAPAFPWSSMEELVRRRATELTDVQRGSAFVSAFRHAELRELAVRGWWIPHGRGKTAFWKDLREAGGWFDPYYDDYGRSAASRRADGRTALPGEARLELSGELLPAGGEGGVNHDEAYPLLLNPYRVMTLSSGSTALMPWLLENIGPLTGSAWQAWIEINPHTARELGLAHGRRVRVVSEAGQFEGLLRHYEGAQPGVVNVPYGLHTAVDGWGAIEPVNPLWAVGDRRNSTGLPDWYGTRVRIETV